MMQKYRRQMQRPRVLLLFFLVFFAFVCVLQCCLLKDLH